VSERIDDLMERMERLTQAGEWCWVTIVNPEDQRRTVWIYHGNTAVAVAFHHPTLRAALEDAITQAEKAVADAH